MSRSSPSAGWRETYDAMEVDADVAAPILEDDDVLDLECRCDEIDGPMPCWPCYRDGRKPLAAAPRGNQQ